MRGTQMSGHQQPTSISRIVELSNSATAASSNCVYRELIYCRRGGFFHCTEVPASISAPPGPCSPCSNKHRTKSETQAVQWEVMNCKVHAAPVSRRERRS